MIDGVPAPAAAPLPARWAKVIDHERCIGCHACTTACKSENQVPVGVTRTYVKYVDIGVFPQARRAFQVTRCNQCEAAPCTAACPTSAMYRRPDGIVDFDKSACIGCKACIAACPYDAIFINPEDHSAEKCNFCAHRLDVGLEPACVVVCPTEAIIVGDLADPGSRVAEIVHREPVTVRRPEKDTRPKLFYRGAHQATLDPLAAQRPAGGLFMWSEQLAGGHHVVAGYPAPAGQPALSPASPALAGSAPSGAVRRPAPANSAAAAVLAYDVPHIAPWDWRVSLYTLTKGLASGVYLVAALLLFLVPGTGSGALWLWAVPVLGGVFLAATGALLIWDLEHPERFWMIFTRPQWRSWLARGAVIIGAYSAVLALHFAAALAGRPQWLRLLVVAGAPLALMTAVYTAYLFAQAKARDLWQNPLLPPHLVVQAAMAGAALLLAAAVVMDQPAEIPALLAVLAIATILHLLFVAGELTLPHGTAHARLAASEMTSGRFRGWFWSGMALAAAAALLSGSAAATVGGSVGSEAAAVWLLGLPASAMAAAGLFAFEHAYVQAGQSVPLA